MPKYNLEEANTNPGVIAAQTKWQHMQMSKWDLILSLFKFLELVAHTHLWERVSAVQHNSWCADAKELHRALWKTAKSHKYFMTTQISSLLNLTCLVVLSGVTSVKSKAGGDTLSDLGCMPLWSWDVENHPSELELDEQQLGFSESKSTKGVRIKSLQSIVTVLWILLSGIASLSSIGL